MGGAGLAAPALIWSLIRPVTFFFGAISLLFSSNEAGWPHSPDIRMDAVRSSGHAKAPGQPVHRTRSAPRSHYALFMLPLANLGAFMIAAAVLILMPGPSILFVIGRSIAYGRGAGVLSV